MMIFCLCIKSFTVKKVFFEYPVDLPFLDIWKVATLDPMIESTLVQNVTKKALKIP